MKIPFNIKYRQQVESGEYKVETRDGRPVKIISFEMTDTNDCPIAAQFRLCAGTPVVYLFDKEGHYKGEGDSDYDLFIVTPEPELSEFEKGYMRIVHKMNPEDFNDEGLKIAKEESAKLLELAKEELQEKIIHDYWIQTADRCVQAREEGKAEALKEIEQDPESSYAFKRGVEYGKEEALKDLPRWIIWEGGACGNSDGHPIALVSGVGGIRFTSVLGATGQKYIMLDDLKKLPGFNE